MTCVPENARNVLLNLVVMLATDIILLLIMLVGLFRLHRHGGGKFGLAQVLWRQVWSVFTLALVI